MGAPDALVSDPTLNLRDVLGVYPLEEVVGLLDDAPGGGAALRYGEGVAHLLNRLLETGVADVVHLEPLHRPQVDQRRPQRRSKGVGCAFLFAGCPVAAWSP